MVMAERLPTDDEITIEVSRDTNNNYCAPGELFLRCRGKEWVWLSGVSPELTVGNAATLEARPIICEMFRREIEMAIMEGGGPKTSGQAPPEAT